MKQGIYKSGWYFTAPWDPIQVRRGDALGFRAGADHFAELLAPGLSNATFDARWIALLAWCLKWSHVAWWNAGGGNLMRREDQNARYAWLRPLELLWVARTLKSGQTTGQLRGRRSIERWFRAGERPTNFAMSPDQFRRYRQVGMYGAYRVVFRKVPGLTTGDGWTPAATTIKLADLVNSALPRRAQLVERQFENGTHWGRWLGGGEARYWIERGWQGEWATPGGLLPTSEDAIRRPLSDAERYLLEPVLFAPRSTRHLTAEVLANAKTAKTHAELCDALANSTTLSERLPPGSLTPLPAFTRFADAAMDAMRGIWNELNHDGADQAPPIQKLAGSITLQSSFGQLREASNAWLMSPSRSIFPHESVVTELAEAMCDAKTPIEQLQALARHHNVHGGGRRWFQEDAGRLVPLVADTGIAASNYRFRLKPLCHLAGQCGVANMNRALDAIAKHEPDDEEGDTL